MLNIEHPEFNSFVVSSANVPQRDFEQAFASLIMETKRVPDPYHFGIDIYGNLLSAAGRKVSNIISRDGYIGRVEGQAFDVIESWVKDNKDKDVIEEVMWISPPYPGTYPDMKIIISSLENTDQGQSLFNKAIIFDFDEAQSLRFTQALAQFSKNYPLRASLEDIRMTPLMLNSEEPSWLSVVQKLVSNKAVWEYIETGKYFEIKEEALREANMFYQRRFSNNPNEVLEAERMAMLALGTRASSCPLTFRGTAFQVFSGASALIGEFRSKDPDYCIHCGACGAEIRQVVRHGQKCPAGCGAVREC